jgi:hypothetical protein
MSAETPRGRLLWPYALGCVTTLVVGLLWQGFATRPAYGQIPDSGAQRLEMIQELQASNKKLTEIAGYLREIRDGQAADRKEKAGKPPAEKP